MCAVIFTLSCIAPTYEQRGWSKTGLVRAAMAGCIYAGLLIPWHSNVVTPAALLGVEPEVMRQAWLPCLMIFLGAAAQSSRR